MEHASRIDQFIEENRAYWRDQSPAVRATGLALLRGQADTVADVAAATGLPESEVTETLTQFFGWTVSDAGSVIANWGPVSASTLYRMWLVDTGDDLDVPEVMCAAGPLAIAVARGRPVRIEGTCAVTGRPVNIEITPEGPTQADPPDALVSLGAIGPSDEPPEIWCDQTRMFASAEAASGWSADHPGAYIVSVADAVRDAAATVDELRRPADFANG